MRLPAELLRRHAQMPPKQPTEGTQTFEPQCIADVRDRLIRSGEQEAGAFQTAAGQVLMRCLPKDLFEQAKKMMRREPGDIGDLRQRERLMQSRLHIVARLVQAAIEFHAGRRARCRDVLDLAQHIAVRAEQSDQKLLKLLFKPAVGGLFAVAPQT